MHTRQSRCYADVLQIFSFQTGFLHSMKQQNSFLVGVACFNSKSKLELNG
jgi:hypothetical protein